MKSTERGTVTMYSGARGFGWIAPEGGGGNVFFHVRNLASRKGFNDTAILPGERVAFQRQACAKGIHACPVRIIKDKGVAG